MILIGYYEEKSSFVEYDSVGNVIVDDNCNEDDPYEGNTAF
jgi:hypothetical protein